MKDVVVLIGAGAIRLSLARRVSAEKWSYFFGQVSGKVKLHLVG
jgi:hypothetical protein